MCFFAVTYPVLAAAAADNELSDGQAIPEITDKTPSMGVTDYNRPDDFGGNCADFANTLVIGGKLIFYVKIFLPLIIIVKATVDMVKVVLAGASAEMNKQVKKLGISVLAGIIIFFIPSLVDTMFGIVSSFESGKTNDSRICSACIFAPYSNECQDYIK